MTLSLPDSVMGTFKVVLTFESVDEILWCDNSNETSSTVLSHGAIQMEVFYIYFAKCDLEFVLNFDFRHSWELGVKGLKIQTNLINH